MASWRLGSRPIDDPGDSVLASVPPGQWRQISPGCNQGRHLGCQGCDCECHPPPGWSPGQVPNG